MATKKSKIYDILENKLKILKGVHQMISNKIKKKVKDQRNIEYQLNSFHVKVLFLTLISMLYVFHMVKFYSTFIKK